MHFLESVTYASENKENNIKEKIKQMFSLQM